MVSVNIAVNFLVFLLTVMLLFICEKGDKHQALYDATRSFR